MDNSNLTSPQLTSKNYAIITHNNTLQCFIEKIRPTDGAIKTRFKNCAILCLTLYLRGGNKGKYELKLVYDGEINKDEKQPSGKRPYYTKENANLESGHTYFTPIEYRIKDRITDLRLNLLMEDLDDLNNDLNVDKINCYIERHGQSVHNKKAWMSWSTYGLELDTSITEEGVTQASNAANALAGILNGQPIDTVFASDLQRTRQTALALFNARGIHLNNNKIVVLPCANELDTSGDGTGNCYEKSATSIKLGFNKENYSACTVEKIQNISSECSEIASSSKKIPIDWSLYLAFYDNKIRGNPNLKEVPNCGDTNMISMAVYYLLNLLNSGSSNIIDNSIGGSKTRKRRHKILFKNNIHNWITRRANNKTKMKPRIKNKMKTRKKQRRYKK